MTKSNLVRTCRVLVLLGAAAVPASAQPGAHPGVDVSLGYLSSFYYYGRIGVYPNGMNGFAMLTTSCNLGQISNPPQPLNVPWLVSNGTPNAACLTPMQRLHPVIAFLAARLEPGATRFVQISDRSYLKHGFYALSDSQCTLCQQPSGGNFLGVGCSDTYSQFNNGDRYWLGPPDEVNPWTGVWSPCGSHFDQGEPPVSPPANTDGARSFINTAGMNAVNHRVTVRDSDLNLLGATYWYAAMYVLPSWTQVTTFSPVPNPAGVVGMLLNEPDANRTNNMGSLRFIPTWTGSAWSVPTTGTFLQGSILQRWTGATVTSNSNGVDDGRLYVGVKVTGPDSNGRYHYEYAVHNRDNSRGVSAFRLPTCNGTQVLNAGFRDIDTSPANDWTLSQTTNEIVFTAPVGNALKWNTVFNFWFDSDAAPLAGTSLLDEAINGPGLPQVSVATTAPLGLYNLYLGAGCGNPSAPLLFASGSPPRAQIPNALFSLTTNGNAPGAICALILNFVPGTTPLGGGCNLYTGNVGSILLLLAGPADGSGVRTYPAPIPNDSTLEGQSIDLQSVAIQAGGAYAGSFNLTNGLRVRIGNSINTCP